MQAELNSDVALSAANALLAHLRRNPQAAMQPARELADTFGLDESFVAQVLKSTHSPRRAEVKTGPRRRNPIGELGRFVSTVWCRATAKPVVFVAASFVTCVLAVYGVISAAPHWFASSAGDNIAPSTLFSLAGSGAVIGTTFLLQMAVYFRHRSARDAVYGALVFFLLQVGLLTFAIVTGDGLKTSQPTSPIVMYAVMAVLLVMMSLFYAGFGSLSAVLGGWARYKLQEREEETMSRQDLLERYFELQSRLKMSAYPRSSGQGPAILQWKWVKWYQSHQVLANLAVGLLISLSVQVCISESGLRPGDPSAELNPWLLLVMIIGIGDFVVYVVQGYLSKTFWSALLGAFCISAGSTLVRLVFHTDLSTGIVGWPILVVSLLVDFGIRTAISCAAYFGAVVQTRALRESNLMQNDQATLLGEMVRIQWKLSNEAASVCVMVVDAARSSEMKAAADPLVVEYTFREYQEWLSAISHERGGRVHSTAGDGAVVAFATCGSALSAARKIQTDVLEFNERVNRLPTPFKLRIGLHVGEVVGDINEVQFTEVIDIAAHVEGVCPIGGVAVTDEVAQRVPEEEFTDLGQKIDGHEVFILAGSTEFR